jgi:hypothetical protein
VAFEFGQGPADALLKDLQSQGGKPVRVAESGQVPVSCFSVESDRGQIVWVANRTDTPVEIMLDGLGGASRVSLTQISGEGRQKPDRAADVMEGRMPLQLGSFEVLRISTEK